MTSGPGACGLGPGGGPEHCALCGDEALPGRVLSVDAGQGTAEVEIGGRAHRVALDLVDGVASGAVVLVHQGFAIGVVGDG